MCALQLWLPLPRIWIIHSCSHTPFKSFKHEISTQSITVLSTKCYRYLTACWYCIGIVAFAYSLIAWYLWVPSNHVSRTLCLPRPQSCLHPCFYILSNANASFRQPMQPPLCLSSEGFDALNMASCHLFLVSVHTPLSALGPLSVIASLYRAMQPPRVLSLKASSFLRVADLYPFPMSVYTRRSATISPSYLASLLKPSITIDWDRHVQISYFKILSPIVAFISPLHSYPPRSERVSCRCTRSTRVLFALGVAGIRDYLHILH